MLRHRAQELLSRRFPSRPESSASPGAGGAGTAEPELPSPLRARPVWPRRPPHGHQLPTHPRRLQAPIGCAPPAGSPGGGAGAKAFPSPGYPHPQQLPHLSPVGGGAPLPSPGRPPPSGGQGSLPGSRRLSPGSILSRRSERGRRWGVGGSPTRSPSPPDGQRGLRGAPGGPGSPRAVRPGRGALPCAPRAAGLGRSHRPRRDGAGRDGVGRAGASRRSPVRVRPSSAGGARVRRSVRPGCEPRESGDSEDAFPNHPHSFPHSLAPPSLPSLPT